MLLLVCVVFGAGMVVGAGGTIVVITHRLRHLVQHPEELPDRLTARLSARLHLSAQQRQRVHALLVEHQARLTAIRRDVQPQVQRELDALHADIAHTLDAAQKRSWDALYGDLRDNWLPPLPPAASNP
ncbi:MAG TPA: hypothetical protein VH253_18775 [Phycisphaerae bacterium]|nr:hypothetical protein [Phycisphaerae bacterium]